SDQHDPFCDRRRGGRGAGSENGADGPARPTGGHSRRDPVPDRPRRRLHDRRDPAGRRRRRGRRAPVDVRGGRMSDWADAKRVPAGELASLVGRSFVSRWLIVDQQRIDAFAKVTEDEQFIHVDPERAGATAFGGTVAHGFLTLSLLSTLAYSALPRIEGAAHGVNYGFDRVRFVHPVRSGTRVRGHFKLLAATQRSKREWQLTYDGSDLTNSELCHYITYREADGEGGEDPRCPQCFRRWVVPRYPSMARSRSRAAFAAPVQLFVLLRTCGRAARSLR